MYRKGKKTSSLQLAPELTTLSNQPFLELVRTSPNKISTAGHIQCCQLKCISQVNLSVFLILVQRGWYKHFSVAITRLNDFILAKSIHYFPSMIEKLFFWQRNVCHHQWQMSMYQHQDKISTEIGAIKYV